MSWQMNNRLEKDFERNMKSLYRQVVVAIGQESDPAVISRKLKIIANQPQFHKTAMSMALTMTAKVESTGCKSWREAARVAGRGNDIYASIQAMLKQNPGRFFEQVRENADYIRSVPGDVAEWITGHVQQESMKGRRAADIAVDILERYPDMLETKAQLIARTEVSKTQLALTRARCDDLGLNWYVWRTAGDSRVRNAHEKMNGVLICWDDPPNPEQLFPQKQIKAYGSYHAGGTFNDRCYAEPVVSLNVISFPAKVHCNGKIVNMTRAQFEKIFIADLAA